MSETIEIEYVEYAALLKDREMLRALEAAGVDNWEGYSEALIALEESDE